jgi:serine/threonine-protein kinase
MGAVYEAVHLGTGRRRALKVMHTHILERADLRQRFQLEARVTADVPSDHIVEVSDAGIDEASGTPFLAMELLQGEELGQRLKRVGRFPPEEALVYLHQTALALDATHRASIVHRDLKPGNVFLAERAGQAPRVKVLDFGIAKIVAESTDANTTMSVGTPYYMAPEQLRGEKVAPATDIYALGMLAYTLLTGEAYWADDRKESDNFLTFAMLVASGPKEPATARAARRGVSLPPAFDAWFARATAGRLAQRFPSATAATAALSEAFGLPRPAKAAASLAPPSISPTLESALPTLPDSRGASSQAREPSSPIPSSPPRRAGPPTPPQGQVTPVPARVRRVSTAPLSQVGSPASLPEGRDVGPSTLPQGVRISPIPALAASPGKGGIEINTDQWPACFIKIDGDHSLADYEQYIATFERLYKRGERFAVVTYLKRYAVRREIVARMGRWFRETEPLIHRYWASNAIVSPSGGFRFVLGTVYLIKPLPVPNRVFATPDEALDFIRTTWPGPGKLTTLRWPF